MSCSPEQGGSQSTQLGHCLATEQSCGCSELEKIVVQLVWTVEWSRSDSMSVLTGSYYAGHRVWYLYIIVGFILKLNDMHKY